MLCCLIMAGGKGTRFWPLSTEEKPKQFLKLVGDETMLQMTVNRVKELIPLERIFISTGAQYVDYIKEQIPGLPKRNIVVEPEGRNTAPCIALSAIIIEKYYKGSTMLVLPSDHLISNEEKFRKLVDEGRAFIESNGSKIITFGIEPNRVETGYGYIKYIKSDDTNCEILKVDRFVEKPNESKAKEYLKDGRYLWNSGMFLWKSDTIINMIKKFTPDIYENLMEIDKIDDEKIQSYIDNNYQKCKSISIDYAVLENSDDIFVIPSDFGWDDIGTWKAVERYKEKDTDNNILGDNVSVINSKSNMIMNNKKKVVLLGIDDVLTLETEDTIYIINKEYMDNLKEYQKLI